MDLGAKLGAKLGSKLDNKSQKNGQLWEENSRKSDQEVEGGPLTPIIYGPKLGPWGGMEGGKPPVHGAAQCF